MATSAVPKKTAQTPDYLKPRPLPKDSITRLWMSAPTSRLLGRSDNVQHVHLVDIEQDPSDVEGLGEKERGVRQRQASTVDGQDFLLHDTHLPFPAVPRTRVLYSRIDNWPNVFPADDVFHYFNELYQLQLNRKGHQLTDADILNSFAAFLCSQGLAHLTPEIQPLISNWLQDEFTDAVLIWERVYFKHYARIRWDLDRQRPGACDAWLKYLEIGPLRGQFFKDLSTYDETEVKPVFSVAEYMVHADPHWPSFNASYRRPKGTVVEPHEEIPVSQASSSVRSSRILVSRGQHRRATLDALQSSGQNPHDPKRRKSRLSVTSVLCCGP